MGRRRSRANSVRILIQILWNTQNEDLSILNYFHPNLPVDEVIVAIMQALQQYLGIAHLFIKIICNVGKGRGSPLGTLKYENAA